MNNSYHRPTLLCALLLTAAVSSHSQTTNAAAQSSPPRPLSSSTTTWIDVTSDAVKIGLGTIIGGVITVVAARQSHKIRLKEEYSRRQRDQLEKISEKFEQVSRFATEYVAALHAVAEQRAPKRVKDALLSMVGHHPIDDNERFMEMLADLHSIEARLALLGLHHISQEVEKYRFMVSTVSPDGGCGTQVKAARQELAESIHGQRTVIFTLMAFAYRDA